MVAMSGRFSKDTYFLSLIIFYFSKNERYHFVDMIVGITIFFCLRKRTFSMFVKKKNVAIYGYIWKGNHSLNGLVVVQFDHKRLCLYF